MNNDHEGMIEVVDAWLAKLYPKRPTWREVADVVEQIGHVVLSRSLRQVYVTGEGMEMRRSRMYVKGVVGVRSYYGRE